MSDIPKISLNLLDHPDEVPEFLAWLTVACQPGKALAIDTETTGFEWWTPHFTRLVQFADTTSGWAIPTAWYGKVIIHAMEYIQRTEVTVVMHNAKFDMHALESDGYPVPDWRNVQDTMVLHHLYHSGKRHALKSIGFEFFGPWATLGQRSLKNYMRLGSYTWADVPVDAQEYWAYGVMDSILTAKVYQQLQEQVQHPAYATEMA